MNERQLPVRQRYEAQDSYYNIFEENHSLHNELNKLFIEIKIYKMGCEIQSEKSQFSDLINPHEKNFYDYIPYNYFMLDAQGLILETNYQAEEVFRIPKNELYNKMLCRYIAPESRSIFYDHVNKTLNTKKSQWVGINILTRHGSIFPAWIVSKSFSTADNNYKNVLSFIIKRDDLPIKGMNRKNSQSGQLNEIILHEINNPLAITANYLYGCIHRIESGRYQEKEILDTLRKAYRQYNNIANIILRLKNFYCQNKLEFKLHDINQIVEKVALQLKSEMEKFSVNIKIRSNTNIPAIKLDELHIQHVLLNLARNSIDAMRDYKIGNPKLWFEINLVNPKKVEICVIDNGPGIPKEIIYKLFDLHFTTKKYGTGLGLSICQNIIEAHGGELLIDSTLTGNTCFKFILPIDQ